MNRSLPSSLVLLFALASAPSCKGGSGNANSETHWLTCRTTADCTDAGLTCVNGYCTSTAGGGGPSIANPTGACVAPDDGSRAGYNSAGDLVWLPDCQSVLKREYWRVYAVDASHAAMLPRPDGASALGAPCVAPEHPLAGITTKYGLCASADSEAKVNIVNSMAISDAFAVARYLQSQLVFVATPEGLGINPFPIPADIIDACALHPGANSAALETICQREADRLRSGIEIGYSYTGPGGVELAARLNELYGIRIESAEGGACMTRGPAPAADAGFTYLAQGTTPPAPDCVPSCTDPGLEQTALSLPSGACQPATSPCNMAAERPCGCTGVRQPSDVYHCACESGRWECVVATRSKSTCLPCDEDAGAAAD